MKNHLFSQAQISKISVWVFKKNVLGHKAFNLSPQLFKCILHMAEGQIVRESLFSCHSNTSHISKEFLVPLDVKHTVVISLMGGWKKGVPGEISTVSSVILRYIVFDHVTWAASTASGCADLSLNRHVPSHDATLQNSNLCLTEKRLDRAQWTQSLPVISNHSVKCGSCYHNSVDYVWEMCLNLYLFSSFQYKICFAVLVSNHYTIIIL